MMWINFSSLAIGLSFFLLESNQPPDPKATIKNKTSKQSKKEVFKA